MIRFLNFTKKVATARRQSSFFPRNEHLRRWPVALCALVGFGFVQHESSHEGFDDECPSFISNACTTAKACGIVGVVGKKKNAKEVLLEGLTILQNRGYDSAGMCTISSPETPTSAPSSFVISKYANADSIARLRREAEKHSGNSVGIAHTRWATQGAKIDANAHPHLDQKDRVAVVHNGTVLNAQDIRNRLHKHGVLFRSDTDTEVIAQNIGFYLDQGKSFVQAVKCGLEELNGTWGVAILAKDSPDEVVVATHGSPIVLGVGEDQIFISSEVSAFRRHARDILELQDGEIVVLKADGTSIDRSCVRTTREVSKYHEHPLNPSPWPDWTLREIDEQPEAIERALNFGGRMTEEGVNMGGLSMQSERMLSIEYLHIIGSGSSFNSAEYGAWLMRYLSAFDTVQVTESSSFSLPQLSSQNAGLLGVSQSGETKSVLDPIAQAKSMKIPVFSIVNVVGSRIAQATKTGVYQNAGLENAVTSQKSFSTQVTAMALVACWFSQRRSEASDVKRKVLMEALQRLPTSFKSALTQQIHDNCKDIAAMLETAESCFVVGQGPASAIAAEGAMKLKELSRLHAREWNGPEDDSPLVLIGSYSEKRKSKVPVIFIILDDGYADQLRRLAAQLHVQGTPVVIITDNKKLATGICSKAVLIPNNGPLTALVSITPLQLIAYELAKVRKLNPDVPRNLSKTVKD